MDTISHRLRNGCHGYNHGEIKSRFVLSLHMCSHYTSAGMATSDVNKNTLVVKFNSMGCTDVIRPSVVDPYQKTG